MIRTGVDIVDVARLDRALTTWPRLTDRLFTAGEQAYAGKRKSPVQHLAARVAAKEAAFKAIGEGWPRLSWTDIEVIRDGDRPRLVFSGKAAELIGKSSAAVSLSHDGGFAVAHVVLFDE
jgi:holo-[acyl-carrier protein] synthase